ncbi:MAG: hypothetical protein HYW65_04885 [Candidatus Liptonbacteria bacterium]|nr:hypothetical protein [Candidatus Liptonbacteria bacterium]
MQFAFFGTPWFAAIILEKLIAGGFVPSVVVCNPDRPVGRKQVLTAPPVKTLIINYQVSISKKIEILQPESLKIENWELSAGGGSAFGGKIGEVDFAVVATYGKIIPRSIFTLPRLGTIGVHHSLLPLHRGPTPVQSAILAGDAETGTSLFLMDEKIDHGLILRQATWNMGQRTTYETLEQNLAELSGELLIKTLPDFIAGKITPMPQDESKATYTKKFMTQDAFIDEKDLIRAGARFNLGATEVKPPEIDSGLALLISRKIRALNPEPGTWTMRGGKRVKLLEAEIRDSKFVLKKIQVEGKKPQSVGSG